MSATKILWGQLLLVSAVVFAFLWAATEWTAWRLGFQPQLGPAWFVIGRCPIYQPLAFFVWWFKFDAYAPRIFIQGGCIAASGGIRHWANENSAETIENDPRQRSVRRSAGHRCALLRLKRGIRAEH